MRMQSQVAEVRTHTQHYNKKACYTKVKEKFTMASSSVKVAVRVRPLNKREIELNCKRIISWEEKCIRIKNPKDYSSKDGDANREVFKDFWYDYSYWSFDKVHPNYASQEMIYEDLGSCVLESALSGYNACVFAYGQTGSGKTYTMMGSSDELGLIPRICQTLFENVRNGEAIGTTYRVEVSYLEIYNETVKDLLAPSNPKQKQVLKIREHPKHGIFVEGLSKHLVTDYCDIHQLMIKGNLSRATASTAMNDTSSRSHAMFTIMFAQAKMVEDTPMETFSKIHLVDLAGSERASSTLATGQRLKEGGHINKSLVTLGSVISAIADISQADNDKKVFVPYRDSVLTWLLKDSLGGNSKTIMIANISPADANYGETLSTLRYAHRAKHIINKPTVNEDPNVKLIRDLKLEIAKLKHLLESSGDPGQMAEKLQKNEAKVKVLTDEWTEKWRETHKILSEQKTLGLRKQGIQGVVLDSDRPYLIGIDDDVTTTGVALYHLKEGVNTAGTDDAERPQDIILTGTSVEKEHCIIDLKDGSTTLIPIGQARCQLNGLKVEQPVTLSQGCVLLLGGRNMFRYNDPVEAAKLRSDKDRGISENLSRQSFLSYSLPNLAKCSEGIMTNSINTDSVLEVSHERSGEYEDKQSTHMLPSDDIPSISSESTPAISPIRKREQVQQTDTLDAMGTAGGMSASGRLYTEEEVSLLVEEEVSRRLMDIESSLVVGDERFYRSYAGESCWINSSNMNGFARCLNFNDDLQRPRSEFYAQLNPNALHMYRSQPHLLAMENGVVTNDTLPGHISVSIPSFLYRGSGRDSHYEYEIKISVWDETWTTFRRFKRFRAFRKQCCQKFGSVISKISFPPRKFFNGSEALAKRRRLELEIFLRKLLAVCLQVKECSLCAYEDHQLSKQVVCNVFPFFSKGLFECSKYDTC